MCVTGEKILITNAAALDRTRSAELSPTLYHVAIKAGLYRKTVQVYHIPITTIYSPTIFSFVRKSLS